MSNTDETTPPTESTTKARFTPSPERNALLLELRKLKPGETASYEELTTRLGFDVESMDGIVRGVRETIQTEGGGTIDVSRGVLRRLLDTEVVNSKAPGYRKKAKAAARRGVRALAGTEYKALSDEDKREHNTNMSALGAINLVLSASAQRKIEAGVEEKKKVFSAEETLKLLKDVS